MTQQGGLARGARGLFAKLQNLRAANVPEAPALAVRDPWPGDPSRGARIVRAELEFLGAVLKLSPGVFAAPNAAPLLAAHLLGFSWLRDLRALGTDTARTRARTLLSEFMDTPDAMQAARPDIAGARIAAWLGHYDFFAASADDDFRARLMGRLVADARMLSAALPAEERDGRAFTALKGLIAASVAMPEHTNFLSRAGKFLVLEIERQVLPDGCHAERSPAAHLAALQDLIEIRALLQAAQAEAPAALGAATERMALALRALRHPDGGLALFNGSKEDLPSLVDLVLAQAGRAVRVQGGLPAGGLYRLAAGKSLVLVDAGAPAAPGLDRFAHAGTLGFEFSAGRERLIVNCGAAPAAGAEWREALRATAAHSTLIIADVNSSELRENGLGRRPPKVAAQRQEATGAHWLEASHDGWQKLFGAIHHRRLYLAMSGEDLRGEDEIEAAQPQPFAVRFHLHPQVTASLQQDNGAVLLRLPSGQGWRLRAEGARITVEESIYFGQAEPRRAEQIVLNGQQDGPQQVKWAITKLG
jgi:uncharacterized heparinase superfamily protein